MREWKIKLNSEKEKGVWKRIVNKRETKEAEVGEEEVIVKRESKEKKGKEKKEVVKSSPGEARRGMETEVGDEEEVFIGIVGSENRRKMKIKFQVADVKKPLMAVKRIVENGNRVVFSEGGSYIVNDKTGDKLKLRENGRGSYLMDVEFVGGGKGEITVDSGAEENVCPLEWGELFKTNGNFLKMKFRGASGGGIEHFGERDVYVTSPC